MTIHNSFVNGVQDMARNEESIEHKILMIFKNSTLGLTDYELYKYVGGKKSTVRAVRCRIANSGQVLWDGTKRPGEGGKLVKVYKHISLAGSGSPEPRPTRGRPPKVIDRGDKIRDAIAGLLSIIQLIETQLPKSGRRGRRKA